ncbi:30S ribosomal protein S9 [Pajaroellobacter abortibovis]|uniref:Small ribosomal subunit protein uS9 n=1 Tax=Pajaroellobacter abortibovis TaxID=1882918 RepID=A0A1L6MYU6_9BACT|nr:30S ribosomal protein S9 [Pajaroellobacter abortibovis]APS00692.1 30S ribosomal protein S9 [Pajaroellobacter abortibovis]
MNLSSRTYATGRRKTAIARVWLEPGKGDFIINRQPLEHYFERETARMIVQQSLKLLEVADRYNVIATCRGGGKSAQAEAVRHGVSRALCEVDPESRSVIKKAGFLTRDARKKERKKCGQPGARKRFQYSKR